MLQFGLRLGAQSGQARLYEYILAHPERVVLDERETIFGTLARKTTRASEGFSDQKRARICWDGPCVTTNSSRIRCEMRNHSLALLERHNANADEAVVAPLLWHANGRAGEFLQAHPTCRDHYRRLTRTRNWFFSDVP